MTTSTTNVVSSVFSAAGCGRHHHTWTSCLAASRPGSSGHRLLRRQPVPCRKACRPDRRHLHQAVGDRPAAGNRAIGHTRYATTGGAGLRNVQPFFAELSTGGLAVAHNGNITNALTVQRTCRSRARSSPRRPIPRRSCIWSPPRRNATSIRVSSKPSASWKALSRWSP